MNDAVVGHLTQAHDELGDDAKAGTIAAHAPEEFRVRGLVDADDLPPREPTAKCVTGCGAGRQKEIAPAPAEHRGENPEELEHDAGDAALTLRQHGEAGLKVLSRTVSSGRRLRTLKLRETEWGSSSCCRLWPSS